MHIYSDRRAYSEAVKAVAIVILIVGIGGCRSRADDRIARAHELGRNPTEPNKNRVEKLMEDDDRDVRATALVVMGGMDPPRAKRMAAAALSDRDGLVRAAAVSILSDAPAPEMIRTLVALATDDPVWQVRARAVDAVAPLGREAVGEVFSRALSDPVRHVRRAALRACAERSFSCPVDRLSALVVEDSDWENRVEAARALGASSDPNAYAGLDAAARDPNEFVRATAAGARRALERAAIPRPPAPPPPAPPPTRPAGEKPKAGV